MLRVGFFGKRVPVLAIATIILLPVLGTTVGIIHPIDGIGGLGEGTTGPGSIGDRGSQAGQPPGQATSKQSAGVDESAGESAVVIASDGNGIQTQNTPNETQITVRDDGSGFWFSTQIEKNQTGSTMQLWVDINNTRSDVRKARLAIEPEAPLEVGDELNTSPGKPSNAIITGQRNSASNVWRIRTLPGVTSEETVADEPIIDSSVIKHRTNRVVADRNRDGNITTADIDFVDTDLSDGVSGIEDLRRNDDGTVTLYLNGSTDDDETYQTISYKTGEHLVIPVYIPEGTSPGTYTVEGQLQSIK